LRESANQLDRVSRIGQGLQPNGFYRPIVNSKSQSPKSICGSSFGAPRLSPLDPVIVPKLDPVMVPGLEPVMVPALDPVKLTALLVREPVIVPATAVEHIARVSTEIQRTV